ncbi:unnamed protein product, partial [Mesorhabditis belari]|uniref:Cytochrome P450 n=1 Tax=Mesorhabditis belari TaxID=2138241 RepID=A0AAF3J7T4_9BILA
MKRHKVEIFFVLTLLLLLGLTKWARIGLSSLQILFSLAVISLIIHEIYWKRRKLPNGPIPWLTLGNMATLATANFDDLMSKWRRKYGGIFTVWIGPFPLVMVNDVGTMKKYFVQNGELFSNRWRNFVTDSFMNGANGLIQIDGEKWREQRRFSLHVLRNFGVGQHRMERKILSEVRHLTSYLQKNGEIDLCTPLAVCVGNIINDMLFGITFPQGSIEMKRLHSLLDAQSKLVVNPLMGLYIAAPFATKIPFLNKPWLELIKHRDHLWDFLGKQVQSHIEMFNNGHSTIDDFTFAYLEEMDRRKEIGETGYFNEWQLQMLLLDLFFAGMETTVTTLKWAFLLMITHPVVMKNVQKELDCLNVSEVGLRERSLTPYTQAVICEIQRIANILPINLLRTVCDDVEIDGYTFPKGTMVIPQISIMLNDETVFEEPKEFRPERFLDDEGKLKRIDQFMPFSLGRRQCLGESLARAELFLIFSNVIKEFDILPVPGEIYSRKRALGLTVSPQKYRVHLVPRKLDTNMNPV